MSKKQPYFMIKSVEKVFRLIEILSEKQMATISDLAKSLNMTRTNVHRLLLTLKDLGYVGLDNDRRHYFLTYRLFSLGCSLPERQTIVSEAYGLMEELAKITHETINLAILRDDMVLYIDKIPSSESLRIDTPIGKSDPCHCTALGKVLLAGLSDEKLQQFVDRHNPLEARTKNTITDQNELIRVVKQARKEGYAIDEEELLEGVCCIARPLCNEKGETVAAISVSGPAVRMDKQRVEELRSYLVQRKKPPPFGVP